MMIREIFVPLLGTSSDGGALDAALAIAESRQAQVTALVTLQHPMPLVTDFGYVPVEVDQRLLDEERRSAKERAQRARAQLERSAVPSEVRVTDAMALWSEETAAMQALHCDLSVVGKPGVGELDGSPRFSLTFRSLLMRSGRPVIIVPPDATLAIPARRVVLAWKPTPEAARALHESLPLLAGVAEVDVLVIEPQVAEGAYGEQPGADIARLLARHDIRAKVVVQPRMGLSTGDCLLRHVRETDADLLVMGGYGHSRVRDFVLGGATRGVLEELRLPVLMSH